MKKLFNLTLRLFIILFYSTLFLSIINCDSDFYELINDGQSVNDRSIDEIPSFNYSRAIVINHEEVGNDNIGLLPEENFPVLINLSGDWLKTTSADPVNGRIENSNGYDITFWTFEKSKKLHHEIEKYDGINGILIAWVEVDSLSKEVDTTIYIFYGNTSIDSPTENPTGVWDPNYKGVWHLKEDPSINQPGNIKDSTVNNINGTATGGFLGDDLVQCKIGSCTRYNALGKYIDYGDVNNFDFGHGNFTVSFWVRLSSSSNGNVEAFVTKCNYNGPFDGIYIYDSSSMGSFDYYIDGTYITYSGTGDSGVWHHLYAVREGTGVDEFKLYVDGLLTTTSTNNSNMTNDASFMIHSWTDEEGSSADGDLRIDEVRVSNSERSADWIVTSYNNQKNNSIGPGQFILSLGAEE